MRVGPRWTVGSTDRSSPCLAVASTGATARPIELGYGGLTYGTTPRWVRQSPSQVVQRGAGKKNPKGGERGSLLEHNGSNVGWASGPGDDRHEGCNVG
jgi:hypothetical protein